MVLTILREMMGREMSTIIMHDATTCDDYRC